MQILAWILRFAVVLVLVWFAVRNAQPVVLYGLPEQTWQAPLVFVLLVAFVGGVVIGLLAWLPTVVRQRRELAKLKTGVPVPVEAAPASAAEAPESPPPAGDSRGV